MLSSSNPTSSMNVPIISIIGIGGIGKTTLAQLAYNDAKVVRCFDLRMWISVNDCFKVRKIINEILDYAIKGTRQESSQLGVLQSQLQEAIRGKRYLLVLDDVWNEDQDEWDKLRNPLRAGADGSKIIVTTRSGKVASIMGTTSPYHITALPEDYCYTLFEQRAFADGEVEDFPNLLPIGRQIVKKCNGLPLAAKILGSLMRFKREETEWSHVQESELWSLDEDENRILSVLRLSYHHLPSHLKRCFAFCAVFPKNYEISKEKLIHLWIAEGLIQLLDDTRQARMKEKLVHWRRIESLFQLHGPLYPMFHLKDSQHFGRQAITMEDMGNEYFNDLLLMSFFEAKFNEDSITFRMHDLIHGLAQYISENEYSMLEHDTGPSNLARGHRSSLLHDLAQTRHASVVGNFRPFLIPEALYEAKKLRTLTFLSSVSYSRGILPLGITVFRHIRALDLSGSGIEGLHSSIGALIYLRYLDLSNTLVETLPETIGRLCNLQTLNLSACNHLMKLPSGTTNLLNLRHLNIKDCARLTHMRDSIGRLVELQTLPVFIVGHTFEKGLFQIKHLNLQGELKIKHLELENSCDWSLFNNTPMLLVNKQLHTLGLSWGEDVEGKRDQYSSRPTAGSPGFSHVHLLEMSRPNDILKKLYVNGYPRAAFPLWMNEIFLPNVTKLVLSNCRSCEELPALGQLPLLKVLSMQGFDAVTSICMRFYGIEGSQRPFPSLNQLTIGDFPNLNVWENDETTESFACLDRLTITKCPKLISMPASPALRHLELQNCDDLILRSAADLDSLSILVIDVFPKLLFIPKRLLPNNSHLSSLRISSCPKLQSLPSTLADLSALKSLKISWCEMLRTLPHGLRNLSSLENLEIIECPSLSCLPEDIIEGLDSLRTISIENCNNLKSLPVGMEHLTALEHLTIMYCPNLVYLPDGLQYLSALRSLNLISCQELAKLPEGLQHAKTLQSLEIRSCPNIKELPEWVENLVSLRSLAISDCQNIRSLPEGLRRLRGLQHLSVRDCPDLEKRCKSGIGEDWDKISHVPYSYIGLPASQQRQNATTSSSS